MITHTKTFETGDQRLWEAEVEVTFSRSVTGGLMYPTELHLSVHHVEVTAYGPGGKKKMNRDEAANRFGPDNVDVWVDRTIEDARN